MQVPADVVARRVDDSVVLVHLGKDQIYSLNATASRFWEMVSADLDTPAIVEQLVGEFDIDEASVRDEISRLTADLVQHGLLIDDGAGG